MADRVGTMSASGRFSRYPAVDRGKPANPSTAAERLGLAPSAVVNPEPVVEVEVKESPIAVLAERLTVPDLSEMTVPEVLAWVGDDEERQAIALGIERDGRRRKGLLKALEG